MLELRNVTKTFGGEVALHPIDLVVESGKTTVLIGPSGCGKSTLLRVMIGLLWPDSGEVLLQGEPITPQNARELRHRMGYIIQDGGLFPHLTTYGNVALLARHLRWSEDKIDARIHELAELTRFPKDGLQRYPAQISGGQRQRVGMMRALMLDPDLVLMDEPMGALDPVIRSSLQEDLRKIFRSLSKTVVIVTHDLAEAAYFGDKLVLLRDGKILQRGTLKEFYEHPEDPFVTTFINAQRSPLEEMKEASA